MGTSRLALAGALLAALLLLGGSFDKRSAFDGPPHDWAAEHDAIRTERGEAWWHQWSLSPPVEETLTRAIALHALVESTARYPCWAAPDQIESWLGELRALSGAARELPRLEQDDGSALNECAWLISLARQIVLPAYFKGPEETLDDWERELRLLDAAVECHVAIPDREPTANLTPAAIKPIPSAPDAAVEPALVRRWERLGGLLRCDSVDGHVSLRLMRLNCHHESLGRQISAVMADRTGEWAGDK